MKEEPLNKSTRANELESYKHNLTHPELLEFVSLNPAMSQCDGCLDLNTGTLKSQAISLRDDYMLYLSFA